MWDVTFRAHFEIAMDSTGYGSTVFFFHGHSQAWIPDRWNLQFLFGCREGVSVYFPPKSH